MVEAKPPGQIDNYALFKQYRDLRPGLEEGHDFVAVAEKSWNQLNSWLTSNPLQLVQWNHVFAASHARMHALTLA